MLVSFRVHLVAGFITAISLVLNCVALFTCHWIDVYYNTVSVGSYKIGAALFKMHSCQAYTKVGWDYTCLVCLFIALFFQCILILHVLTSLCVRRFNVHVLRVDLALIGLSTFFLCVGTVTFLIGACIYFHGKVNFGYSFYLSCIAIIISSAAGGSVGHALKRIRDCGDCECEGYYY